MDMFEALEVDLTLLMCLRRMCEEEVWTEEFHVSETHFP